MITTRGFGSGALVTQGFGAFYSQAVVVVVGDYVTTVDYIDVRTPYVCRSLEDIATVQDLVSLSTTGKTAPSLSASAILRHGSVIISFGFWERQGDLYVPQLPTKGTDVTITVRTDKTVLRQLTVSSTTLARAVRTYRAEVSANIGYLENTGLEVSLRLWGPDIFGEVIVPVAEG